MGVEGGEGIHWGGWCWVFGCEVEGCAVVGGLEGCVDGDCEGCWCG